MPLKSPIHRSIGTRRRVRAVLMTAALASGALLAGGVMAGNAVAAGPSYSFHKLDNTGDLTFNQLLGINIRDSS
jgi:hypothetical protein